ncbi:PucR family transcriptional regulator [Oceanobacillus salinisoli]|uniref:PucR family transcriptional regulator n=1 Tax=Oceanobacillus salinisoli TaxID=2678611 RepID=UPI0012E2A106|nr:PucR family transcriptional regulator [Oceanobacillus salinisoli]
MESWKVTIKDVLARDIFNHAKLIAGLGGGYREVKWTHILEMDDFESFINGGELILTTGSNIQFDSPVGIPKINKLIEKDVAGICIELGTNVTEVSPAIIEFANQHNFPIITFEQIVKFVDITQDLHTILINHHHQMLNKLHVLSKQFNELSLEPNGILKILKELHYHFDSAVLLLTDDTKTFYYPPKIKNRTESIHSLMDKLMKIEPYKEHLLDNEYYIFFPIKGLGHSWGNLCLQKRENDLDEFSFSIIDRAALAIAQIMLRNRTIEERKQNQEEEIVQKLVNGEEYHSSEINKVLPSPAKNLFYRVILIESSSNNKDMKEEDWEEIKLQQSIILRSLFKNYGFFPAMSVTKDKIAIIASFYKNGNAKKDTESFIQVTNAMKQIQEKNVLVGNDLSVGISKPQKDFSYIAQCYQEANDVLFIQKTNILNALFYEEIGVYRLLISLFNHEELESFVWDHLGPLLEYDQKMKGNLLITLSVYLETMGSKKETADRLFIVRQTLYHRLEKIKELLGEEFMEPVNRQAIELAVSAYSLIHNNSENDNITLQ